MAVDFFEKELKGAQNRFNKIFGDLVVCNIKTRQMLILAICGMGLMKTKIDNAHEKEAVREEIKKFVRYRNVINDTFNKIETQLQERRKHGNTDYNTRENRKTGFGR